MAKKNILTWAASLIGTTLFAIIFFEIRLYADFFEQIYLIGAALYGWWYWLQPVKGEVKDRTPAVRRDFDWSSPGQLALGVFITLGFTALFIWIFSHIHLWAPFYFPEPATYVFWDSLTTGCCVTAQILMARKRLENWVYWAFVNVICTILYYIKDIKLISLLYFVFLILSVVGFQKWRKGLNSVPNI